MVQLQRKQNKAVIYKKDEYSLHLIVKILIQRMLLEKGYDARTEHIVCNSFTGKTKIVDCVDLDRGIAFEVERHASKEYIEKQKQLARDLRVTSIVVNLETIPKHISDAIQELDGIVDKITEG